VRPVVLASCRLVHVALAYGTNALSLNQISFVDEGEVAEYLNVLQSHHHPRLKHHHRVSFDRSRALRHQLLEVVRSHEDRVAATTHSIVLDAVPRNQ
ncbi:unnamed protein product, partial [Ectocarpus sp. 13 AM-2016]